MADLPGLAADGSERNAGSLGQLERAQVILHCIDATDPGPAAERLAIVCGGINAFASNSARQVVVATKCDVAPAPLEAEFATSAETGEGIAALRSAVLEWIA